MVIGRNDVGEPLTGQAIMDSTFPDFEIKSVPKKGGIAVVYEARQVSLDRTVALKVLPPELAHDDTFAQRFLHEARQMARLDHRNIAKVFAVGEAGTHKFFAMQFLSGGNLEEKLAGTGSLPLDQAVSIAADVAEALAYSHEHGIVHRDVKPANIMFDEHGSPMVTDFGIAKASDGTHLTSTGMVLGSPPYMPPEQVLGNPVDGRADIYSLGIVLFLMVTGRLPFDAETPMALAMMHVHTPPPDPRTLNPAVPEWLAGVILRCLAKQPGERFASARELSACLKQHTGTMPGLPFAQAPPTWQPTPGLTLVPTSGVMPPVPQVQSGPTGPRIGRIVAVATVLAILGSVLVGAVVYKVVLSGRYAGSRAALPGERADVGPHTEETTFVPAMSESEVRQRFAGWEKAWESQDLPAYLSYYDDDVVVVRARKQEQGKATLRDSMQKRWAMQKNINIESSDVQIAVEGDRARLGAKQTFTSNNYSDRGTKHLVWKKRDGQLLIVEESFDEDWHENK